MVNRRVAQSRFPRGQILVRRFGEEREPLGESLSAIAFGVERVFQQWVKGRRQKKIKGRNGGQLAQGPAGCRAFIAEDALQARVDYIPRATIEQVTANNIVKRRVARKLVGRYLEFLRQARRQPLVEIAIVLAERHDGFTDHRDDFALFDENQEVFPEV